MVKMIKKRNKQLELFSVDEMYGCIGVKDEIDAISVAAYLWAIKVVSDLDDDKFRNVKKECDTIKIGEGEYFVPSIPGSMTIFQLDALRDCLNLREHAAIGEKYVHHYTEANCRPHVTDAYSFVMARKAFQEYFNKEFRENGWWITDLNLQQLSNPYSYKIFKD